MAKKQADRILEALKAGPMFPAQIAAATGIDITSVYPQMTFLSDRGKVLRERLSDGKRVGYRYTRSDAPIT